ncbi:MAG: hypothetical protein LBE02_09030 [Spirochaetaceae bacterium]|jgi:outer membrane protein assembly factor BamD (BamD/ComL family)|nr:hypothetical protein [Spirochaetaceae bacterium]
MKIQFGILWALLLPVSCVSGPIDIPEDMTPAKIIQNAQKATDVNNYKGALQYYQALLERYGNVGEHLCTGEYEIAFIKYKQKKYAEARQGFENLLALYAEPGGESLPAQFRVLSEKMLSRLAEQGR